jgi:mRNA-degrading endonuclease RelE of RelBE toxin-antitoxin system
VKGPDQRQAESRNFTERLRVLVDDDDYRIFQNELQYNPEKGAIIKGAGGVRKVRMRLPGRGKSGGARVIYLYLENHAVIYLLTLSGMHLRSSPNRFVPSMRYQAITGFHLPPMTSIAARTEHSSRCMVSGEIL